MHAHTHPHLRGGLAVAEQDHSHIIKLGASATAGHASDQTENMVPVKRSCNKSHL